MKSRLDKPILFPAGFCSVLFHLLSSSPPVFESRNRSSSSFCLKLGSRLGAFCPNPDNCKHFEKTSLTSMIPYILKSKQIRFCHEGDIHFPNTSSAVSNPAFPNLFPFHRGKCLCVFHNIGKAISPSVCDRQTIAESVNGCLMTNGENFVFSIFMCRNTLAVSLIPLLVCYFSHFLTLPQCHIFFFPFLSLFNQSIESSCFFSIFCKTHSTPFLSKIQVLHKGKSRSTW